ncbi:MAG: hypothetical protein KGR17_07280 [Acidobacteria bacterium]|nr:hypothetical protein [Acidobacteriota bacterium]
MGVPCAGDRRIDPVPIDPAPIDPVPAVTEPSTPTRAHDHGQVLPLMVLVMVTAVLALLLVVRIGQHLDLRARVRTAADAAALAGASGGEVAARTVAADNGAEIVSFVSRGVEVEVVVRVGGERASARARSAW